MERGVNIYKRVFARDVWEKVFGPGTVYPPIYIKDTS